MNKQLDRGVLVLSLMVFGLTACGAPDSSNATRKGLGANSTSSLSAETTAKDDPAAKEAAKDKSKATKAEQQANLRRDIQLKKDTLSRTQSNLARKEQLLAGVEGRLTNVSLNKAGVVPAPSGSALSAIVTENYAGAIGAVVSKRTAQAAADKSISNLTGLEQSLLADLKVVQGEIAVLELAVEELDAQITEMTIQLNEIK